MKSQSTSSSFSGLNRQDPKFRLVRSKGITPVTLLQLRVESCEDRREQQSELFFFSTILKRIIRDLDDDDVVSMNNFRNCYNLPYTALTYSHICTSSQCSSLNRNVRLLLDFLSVFTANRSEVKETWLSACISHRRSVPTKKNIWFVHNKIYGNK